MILIKRKQGQIVTLVFFPGLPVKKSDAAHPAVGQRTDGHLHGIALVCDLIKIPFLDAQRVCPDVAARVIIQVMYAEARFGDIPPCIQQSRAFRDLMLHKLPPFSVFSHSSSAYFRREA